MTLETLLLLRQALAETVRSGFDITSPDFDAVITAKRELDAAIEEAQVVGGRIV